MSRKKRQNIILGIIVIVVIGFVIVYYYSAEQTRIKGFTFGNNLQRIQEDLKKIQTEFQSEITVWEDGDISKDEFLGYSDMHISKMEELVSRYDILDPPEVFSSSVELFKLSTQSQLESDKEIIRWIQSGDIDAKIRSDSLMEESFGYEMAALAKFNAVKAGIDP
ncbi:MAG: hypothetical protein XU09_C0006G0125 [Thaumarchaeota archaeon CSP1-1]|nr:MAG: hypothetical protein XU09_C0006G0125 [Thaumarchaeota archaeon CSP1-1]